MEKPKKQLVALKRMTYGTRRLLPGDEFEAKPSDAKVWILLGKARPRAEAIPAPPPRLVRKVIEAPPVVTSPPPPVVQDAAPDALTQAREDYALKLGKRPYHGWDVEELRRRISEAE